MQILQHKVVASLPVLLQPDSIYYVRNGTGFDQYITNGVGTVTAYALNITVLAQDTGESTVSAMSQKAVTDALKLKVDKVTGKGLSDTNFTQAEKDKLASLESSKFVGLFVGESALPSSGSEGDYANVDGGAGSDVYRVIWDTSDAKWVKVKGASTELTSAQIKQEYESNPDTNAFTDSEKTKLASVGDTSRNFVDDYLLTRG